MGERTAGESTRNPSEVASAPKRLTAWAATAVVVSEVVGVGIFLTPATMLRTLGGIAPALTLWLVMGALSAAGALCYAELSTRFPRAGGSYIYLREAFGPKSAFMYGWVALLVVDPGITAALGIGFAKYALAIGGLSPALAPRIAIGTIAGVGLLTLIGSRTSAALVRWAATAKLAIVAFLVGAALRFVATHPIAEAATAPLEPLGMAGIAGAVIGAFFAFGGWWDLGRMTEEVAAPRRTMPRALLGGIALVTAIYALVTLAFMLVGAGASAASDEVFVAAVAERLFGRSAGPWSAAMVAVAVAGSLVALLLAAPRVYLALARDGLFPRRLARVDAGRGVSVGATLVQVTLAGLLVLLGTFDQILGYFIPVAVFFLGLSALAVLKLPRVALGDETFRMPLHPLPLILFLTLIAAVLLLLVVGRPRESLVGATITLAGLPVAGYAFRKRGPSERARNLV